MTHHLRLFLILVLIAITAVQCQSLRTRANQIRVARVRRIEDASGDQ
jgi:hypothetical protein